MRVTVSSTRPASARFTSSSRPVAPVRSRIAVFAHGESQGHGHGHGSATAVKTEKDRGFIAEMRKVAMKLHTKDQAPKEGGTEAPKPQVWTPTRQGYLLFLAESKVVYDALEKAVLSQQHPEYAKLRNTGLERGAALARDIALFEKEYGMTLPEVKADGPGMTYAKLVQELAEKDPAGFICHYYNYYFAHTAGGRMIGSKVSQMVLDSRELDFYKWESDVNGLLEGVRKSINDLAEGWNDEQKKHCLEVTEESFKYSGVIMRCITQV